ncbi:MAG: peptidoglycan-binding domain-containing protein, partial [bacterium]
PALSPAEACGIAEKYQLVCERLENSSLPELHSLGVSALVSLFNQSEGKDFYFLTPKSSETASLSNSRGEIILHREELDSRWDLAATVIWTPPPGFTSPLMPGAQNESVVGFIESRLQAAGLLEPNFISGGIYSKYLVDQVKVFQGSRSLTVDGIAGMRTLMAFSTVDGGSDSPDSASLVVGE